uniref:Defensin 1 n=1 Tax=Holotrichia oblita TaxID=644536 RepID=A0A8D4IZJ9_HOLOL|nr:defensin 1 [Holotrichia oblita]
MSKLIVIAIIVSFCIVQTFAVPISEEFEGSLLRQKRVTCDLLSLEAKGIAINDSACAAHCLVLGRKGGSCKDGVCVCRN